MKQKNKQNIKKIIMMPKAVCFCPLGDDWYTNEFTVEMRVGDWYPDYCDVEKFLNENIRGKALIIEDAVRTLYDYFCEYQPYKLHVTSNVYDATSHSPVEVSI